MMYLLPSYYGSNFLILLTWIVPLITNNKKFESYCQKKNFDCINSWMNSTCNLKIKLEDKEDKL